MTQKEIALIADARRRPHLTNCYLSYPDLVKKIEKKEIHRFYHEDIMVLVHMMQYFCKMYFFIKNNTMLDSDSILMLKKELMAYPTLVVTIATREIYKENVKVLEKLGFRFHKYYIRKQMIMGTEKMSERVHETDIADVSDINAIHHLLHNNFDIYSDHLVSKDELQVFLESSHVLKICEDGKLAGVLLFESFGKKSYLRCICVAKEYSGKKLGRSLLESYIKKNREGTKLFYLWVESTNKSANCLYESVGYKDDGLKEYIYLKREDKNEPGNKEI